MSHLEFTDEMTVDQGLPGEDAEAKSLLHNRNFMLLWGGEAISLLGDQFHMIALPWLVLQMTGDHLLMGTVLALAAVPRALFMLIGGAMTDRFSPRTVMLASNLSRFILVTLLAALVLGGTVQLWMLYVLALAFGLADAFYLPAQGSFVPQLVREKQLSSANAMVQGIAQISLFVGPVLAGFLIALFGGGGQTGAEGETLFGIGLAFFVDALTFVVSAITLWMIRVPQKNQAAEAPEVKVFSAITEGLGYVWRDETLRYFFLVVAAVATIVNSLIAVGVPVLADNRFSEGAAAFGIIISAYGAGSLVGILLAGVLPKPPDGHFGSVLLAVTAGAGLGLVVLGLAGTTWTAAAITLLMGTSLGYVVIQFTTWLQMRTPEEMMGRMMSILMFAAQGLAPVGTALAGALIGLNLSWVFLGAGLLLLGVVSLAMTNRTVRIMSPKRAAIRH
jgi:MFS family permease